MPQKLYYEGSKWHISHILLPKIMVKVFYMYVLLYFFLIMDAFITQKVQAIHPAST
jgi:hypothetical protein